MAIEITSSTQSTEEMAAALQQAGRTVVQTGIPEKPAATEPPATDPTNPSVPPVNAGESLSAQPDGGTAPASEAGGTPPQGETPAGEKPEDPTQPPRGNFEKRRKTLERQVNRLQEDLELERGSKGALQRKLDEAEAKLAAIQPPPAAEPAKDAGPVKPKRPTQAECDYDPERYEAALEVYDEDLGKYHTAMAVKQIQDQQAADEAARTKREQEAVQAKAFGDFVAKKEQGRAEIPDWDEVFEELGETPIDMPAAVEVAVLKSDNPAALIHFFAKDVLTNDAAEMQRIAKLDPVGQVLAIAKLETRLSGQPSGKTATDPKPPKPAARPAAAAEPPAPAPKKPVAPAAVEPPIEPVGSRASATGPGLSQANDPQAYFRMRNAGVNRP